MRQIVGFLIGIAFGWSSDLFACSCGDFPTPLEAQERASAVFEGVVVNKAPFLAVAPAERGYGGAWTVVERWTFQVERSWKGGSRIVEITQGYSNCSEIYGLGQRALVYAYPHEFRSGELETHKCASPVRLSFAEQASLLGPPSAIFGAAVSPTESSTARLLRHSEVYFLAALAAARNVFLGEDALYSYPNGPGVAIIVATVVFGSLLVASFLWRRRRMTAAALALISVALWIGSVVWVSHNFLVANSFFGHLIEYNCVGCPTV